jgi:ribokinase
VDTPLRIGVIGHVEHITIGRVGAIPGPGEIAHLEAPLVLAGGGGGIALFQLTKSPAEIHLFTALGDDEAARFVERQIVETGAILHAARRREPHTRDLVMVGPEGDRTIIVLGEPLHPAATDPLPWELLGDLDAVYFTAQDPAVLARARDARIAVATARRRPSIVRSGVRLDAVIGSRFDPREVSSRDDYPVPPDAVVMTEGAQGGAVETAAGTARFTTPQVADHGGSYGAGDTFAAAFVYHLAAGAGPLEAAERSARFGAASLGALDPLSAQQRLPGPS